MTARMQIFSMSKIKIFSHTPKKMKNSRNTMNDNNLLLNDIKNASFQVQQELNYFNKNIQPKFLLEKGIPFKYDSNISKDNTFYGSFSRNSKTKKDSFKISNILTPENNKKSSFQYSLNNPQSINQNFNSLTFDNNIDNNNKKKIIFI